MTSILQTRLAKLQDTSGYIDTYSDAVAVMSFINLYLFVEIGTVNATVVLCYKSRDGQKSSSRML